VDIDLPSAVVDVGQVLPGGFGAVDDTASNLVED